MRMFVSTKRMTIVEFVAGEIVRGFQPDTTGAEFGTEFLLLTGEALELGLGCFADGETDEEVLEQSRDGGGLLRCLHARPPVKLVFNADGDVFHGLDTFSQLHSAGKLAESLMNGRHQMRPSRHPAWLR